MQFQQLSRASLLHRQTPSPIIIHRSTLITHFQPPPLESFKSGHFRTSRFYTKTTPLPLSYRNLIGTRPPDTRFSKFHWKRKTLTQGTVGVTMGDHSEDLEDLAVELIFDFDGTITTEDTIRSLANSAMDIQVRRGRSRSQMESAWTAIEQSYVQDLTDHHNTYVPPDGKSPDTPLEAPMARIWPVSPHLEKPVDIMLDRLSCRQRHNVELASLARVKDEGLFKGISQDHLLRAGQQDRLHSRVRIREGFDPFITQAKQQDHGMHVLSVNWSTSYIQGVLGPCGITEIIANTTNPEDGSISALAAFQDPNDQDLWPEVLTVAHDKLIALRYLYCRRKLLKPDRKLLLIYFGDSATDLECFLTVGGVIISADEGGGLLSILRQELDHHIPHVSEWKEGDPTCWARGFNELLQHNYLTRKILAAKKAVSTKTSC